MTAPPRFIGEPRAGSMPPPDGQPASVAPAPIGPAPPLDTATVRVLHDAVRAALRLRAGVDPGWTWSGHPEREFLRGVRGHHVSGLISAHSAELGMPATLREDIARHADRVALKSLAHAGLLRAVHRRLETAGVPALFVKGLAIEAQTGRQLGERGGGDIDVWVSPDRVESAVDALGPEWTLPDNFPQPGPSWAWRHWQRWGSELPLVGPVTVDLHWHLHCVRGTLPDFAEAWAARQVVLVGGHAVPTLSRAHALAHACRHADTDRWRILRSLVDVHLLLTPAASPVGATPALPGWTVAVVERAIGLPHGRSAAQLSSRRWAAALDEQRHLGNHAVRVDRLSRPAYLARVIGRFGWGSRHPLHDGLVPLWSIAVAPPHESGRISTSSPVNGVRQGLGRRIRYEWDRAIRARHRDR